MKGSFNRHLSSAEDVAHLAIYDDPLKLPSLDWNCDDDGACTAEDHFHTPDGLVWPRCESGLEKSLSHASAPQIAFRNFQLQILSECALPSNSLWCAIWATRKSVKCTYGKEERLITKNFRFRDVDNILKKRKLPKALAKIGHEVQGALRQVDRAYKLGIILPGGSHIFWPEGRFGHGSVKLVFIKASEIVSERNSDYRFEPVRQGPYFTELEITQTIHFVDLPAEIRNMIYNQILVEDVVPHNKDRMRQRQPPISLTCRLANKEIMSLLFQKYGWFVV